MPSSHSSQSQPSRIFKLDQYFKLYQFFGLVFKQEKELTQNKFKLYFLDFFKNSTDKFVLHKNLYNNLGQYFSDILRSSSLDQEEFSHLLKRYFQELQSKGEYPYSPKGEFTLSKRVFTSFEQYFSGFLEYIDLDKSEFLDLLKEYFEEQQECTIITEMAYNEQTPYSSKLWLLLIFLSLSLPCGKPAEVNPDLYRNQLHFGYGINYKYNGLLYHNLDRVWVVHRIVIPKLEDLEKFPSFPDKINCHPPGRGHVLGHTEVLNRKMLAGRICEMTEPHIQLLRRRAAYHKGQVVKLIKEDLYHALHSLDPVSTFEYKRTYTKRALTPPQEQLLVNGSLTNTTPFSENIPRNRTKRIAGAFVALGKVVLPAIGKLATLAVEELGSYLQRKRNRAMTVAMNRLDDNVAATRNQMHLLEKDFLLYGEYDVNSTQSIIGLLDSLNKRTSGLERWLNGSSTQWLKLFFNNKEGLHTYSHMWNLYTEALKEKYIRLYEALEHELHMLLRSIEVLSKGYLPAHLFPPSKLAEISQKAIDMIKTKNPDYVLALPHIVDYYDMRLVTFGVDDQGKLVVCFPIFIKDFKKEPMTLYQLETVKVPVTDENKAADSYTEVAVSKPYLASNREYYIQLVLPELVMCKKIRHTYYCEELFLVKHKTKHSCESAIFYNLTRETILENCEFNYFYNTSVMPTVLDGGNQILLANMLKEKRLICSYDQGLAKPLPAASYALVSRDILCHCHLQVGLTYILKNIASCNMTEQPKLEYTVNLGFMDYFHHRWGNTSLEEIPTLPTLKETVLPLALEDYSLDPNVSKYAIDTLRHPNTLAELSLVNEQKRQFLQNKKEFVFEGKAGVNGVGPQLPKTPLKHSRKIPFLFTAMIHIYYFVGSSLGILWAVPYILYAIKQRKIASLVAAMTLYQRNPAEAAPVTEIMKAVIPAASPIGYHPFQVNPHPATKLVCQDPWVSFIVTSITILGILLYLYRMCKHLTIVKGHRFANICHLHLVIGNATRYVPIKIGDTIGSPFLFQYTSLPSIEQITLQKECLWDHVHFSWGSNQVYYKEKKIPLRQHVTIPLSDKLRVRNIASKDYQVMFMVKQGETWYSMSQKPSTNN